MLHAFKGQCKLERFPVRSYNRILEWVINPQVFGNNCATRVKRTYTPKQRCILQVNSIFHFLQQFLENFRQKSMPEHRAA